MHSEDDGPTHCRWCGKPFHCDRCELHDKIGSERECERLQLRKLCDDLIAVARKVGSGMPILSDPVVQRANELASRRD